MGCVASKEVLELHNVVQKHHEEQMHVLNEILQRLSSDSLASKPVESLQSPTAGSSNFNGPPSIRIPVSPMIEQDGRQKDSAVGMPNVTVTAVGSKGGELAAKVSPKSALKSPNGASLRVPASSTASSPKSVSSPVSPMKARAIMPGAAAGDDTDLDDIELAIAELRSGRRSSSAPSRSARLTPVLENHPLGFRDPDATTDSDSSPRAVKSPTALAARPGRAIAKSVSAGRLTVTAI